MLRAFPNSRGILGIGAVLAVSLFTLAALSWFSVRPLQVLVKLVCPIWQRAWLRYILAAIWLVASFWLLWRFRLAFQQPWLASSVALFGYGLVTGTGLALWLAPPFPHTRLILTRQKERIVSLLLVVGWIGFGFYLWGENLGARWWITDDHNIVSLIGNAKYLALSEIPLQLQAIERWVEVVPFATLRFRPAFWLSQSLESALWGDQPLLWYFFRISIFTLACVVTYTLLKPLLGMLNSLLFTLLLATFSFWDDIMPRLGPAENYALLGLLGYAFAYVAIARHYSNRAHYPIWRVHGYWVLLGLSAVYCIGAKENFVILLLPNTALFLYLVLRRQIPILGIVVLAISTGFGLLSLASVFVTNMLNGADVYGNSSAPQDRLANLLRAIQDNLLAPSVLVAFGGVLLVLGIGFIILYREKDRAGLRQLGRSALICGVLAIGLIAMYAFQLYLYNGALPTNTRYDMPGSLFLAFLGLIGVVLVLVTIHVTLKRRFYDVLAALVLASSLAGFIFTSGYDHARQASRANLERTQLFDAQLAMVEAVARTNPEVALVLDTHSGNDFEASYSVVQFLRRDGIENPIFLRYWGSDYLDAQNPRKQFLAGKLRDVAQGALYSQFYEPFHKFVGNHCIGIGFSGDSAPPCVHLTQIW
jgi:hypothetical protein